MYRVSDQLFAASNSNDSEPPHFARQDSGSAWCTEDLDVHDSPYLEVQFGVDVEIRAVSTAGWPRDITSFRFSSEYIRSYQIQYARAGESLRYVTDQTTSPKVL